MKRFNKFVASLLLVALAASTSCSVPVRVVNAQEDLAPVRMGAVSDSDFNTNTIPSVASNMTGSAVLTGTSLLLAGRSQASFHAIWTSTPTGTFTFEGSNDVTSAGASVTNWTVLTVPAAFASGNPAGAASSFIFEFSPITTRWIRIKYTNSASSGTLVVNAELKP